MFSLTLGQTKVYLTEQPLAFDGLLSAFPRYGAEAEQRFASPRRRREWLSVRQLLHEVSGSGVSIVYDSSGRPQLKGSDLHISIAHSGHYAAIALSSSPAGLDIEQAAGKAERLKARFSTEEERRQLSPVEIWCAKEAVYKLFPHSAGLPLTAIRILSPERAVCQRLTAKLHFSRLESLHICVAEET